MVSFAPSEFPVPDRPPDSVFFVSPCVVVDVFDSVSSASSSEPVCLRPRNPSCRLSVLGASGFVFGSGPLGCFVGFCGLGRLVVEALGSVLCVRGLGLRLLPSVSVKSLVVSAKDAMSADGSSESWVSSAGHATSRSLESYRRRVRTDRLFGR